MDFDKINGEAMKQVRSVLPYIMDMIRQCDEQPDSEGFCRCSRYIEHWLFLFKRNELLASARVEELTDKI